jgi:hypothetical protein
MERIVCVRELVLSGVLVSSQRFSLQICCLVKMLLWKVYGYTCCLMDVRRVLVVRWEAPLYYQLREPFSLQIIGLYSRECLVILLVSLDCVCSLSINLNKTFCSDLH